MASEVSASGVGIGKDKSLAKVSKKKTREQDDDDYYEPLSSTETEYSNSDPDWDWEPEPKQSRKKAKRLNKQAQGFAGESADIWRNVNTNRKIRGGKQKRNQLGQSEATKDKSPRQCYFITCRKAARKGSKYCSDECGIRMAKKRILMILPDRLAERGTSWVAVDNNHSKLTEIKETRLELSTQYDELEEKRKVLDAFIDAVSKINHDPKIDPVEVESVDEGPVAACMLCGQDNNAKTYLKHLERCYIRIEKNVAFETKVPKQLPGTRVFCHVQDKSTGLYCTRLHANCPDHSKPMLFDNKVVICGAPLSMDKLDLKKVCRLLKSNCIHHYNWENTRRADIDIQKVVIWTKLEHLQKEEKKLNHEIDTRGGLLDLLLNSTKTESS